MDCLKKNAKGEEILLDYASGILAAPQREELELHLAGCGECRNLVAAQRELWQTLDAWEAPEPGAGFDARLRERIAAAPEPWWNRVFAWRPLAAAGAAAAVVGIGLLVLPGGQPAPEPAAQARPEMVRAEAVNVEVVEQTLEDLEILTPVSTRTI